MKPSTRLESAVFQLTPTRTRYDLFIIADGKKEKVATGLLNPYLAHLKTAEDQISKGGYSIMLKPKADDDAIWFTKGTVERFVRFVSTPEILERVYTIESEIVQIGKAIGIQGNNENGIISVEDCQAKPLSRIEACSASNSALDADEEKAIILYTSDSQLPGTNGSITQEGNSKVQLLKVLETRINVLRKEQSMAFARAAAAGFNNDHMEPLVSFAKCFGASRLMVACLKFVDLWKGKHEYGQLIVTEAAEAMPKTEFSTINASGTMLSDEKASGNGCGDTRAPVNHQSPITQHEFFPGQYPQSIFPPWPMHSPSSVVPFYQGLPVQTPFCQNYSPNGSYYQPPYQTWDASQVVVGHQKGQTRQSTDGKIEPDSCERDITKMKSDDVLEEKETSHHRLRKKAGRSGKKQLGTVVIRNINYVTSSETDSNSEPDSGVDKDDESLHNTTQIMKDQDCLRSFERIDSEGKPSGEKALYDWEGASIADGGHWQAFQNCLLRDTEEDSSAPGGAMWAREKNVQIKRPPRTTGGHDPLAFTERDTVELQSSRLAELQKDAENLSSFSRVSNDEFSVYIGEGAHHSSRLELGITHMTNSKGRNILYQNESTELITSGGQGSQSNLERSSDFTMNGYEIATNNLAYIADESFTLPFRSMSVNQVSSGGRTVIDLNSEIQFTHQSSENIGRTGNQVSYEPNELSLLPERGSEKRPIGYDPALDYEKQFFLTDVASKNTKYAESSTDAKQGSKKTKGSKSKTVSEISDKKKSKGPIMRGNPSKMNPLEEARMRAERLRSYKADLQKLKKEKEEAEQRRIESLKMERRRRIAARGSLTSAHSLLPSSASRKSLPTKLSPISQKGSKFSDTEPGPSSPLQRSKIRTVLYGATDSKVTKVTKSIDGSHKAANRLTRSLSLTKAESNVVTPDSKDSMARIRRLSEPKLISSHPAFSTKMSSAGSGSKAKASVEFEGKRTSALAGLHHRKVLSLPELKIEPYKGPVKVNHKKSPEKEVALDTNRGKSFVTSGNEKLDSLDGRLSRHDIDDDTVIEKTVVILECQKPCVTAIPASQEKLTVTGMHNRKNVIGEALVVPESTAIHATTLPVDRLHKEQTIRTLESPSYDEVITNDMEKKSANLTSAHEKSDQASSARVPSLEYPCNGKSDCGKVLPNLSKSRSVKAGRLHNSDLKNLNLEEIPKAFEQVKEPPKSVRRFLKFGRRNHSSTSSAGEEIAGSDSTIADGSKFCKIATNDSTIKVQTLKNLMSQEETPKATAAKTSKKSSLHFSLLSPFRSKTSQKKLVT